MEGLYSLAKMVVEKKGAKNNFQKAFYTIILYALLCKFNNHPELVCDVFLDTEIVIDPSVEFDDLLKKYNLNGKQKQGRYCQVEGISSNGKSIRIHSNGKIELFHEKTLIICNSKNKTIEEILNSSCHEMSHLIKNKINNLYYHDKGNEVDCFLRSGLHIKKETVNKKNLNMKTDNRYTILEEAINTLQTTDALRFIKSLNYIDVDNNVRKILNIIDYDDLEKDKGYDDIVILFRMLWNNDRFRNIIENEIIEGNIENIFDLFDNICDYPGALEEIAEIFDKLDKSYSNSLISIRRSVLTKKYKKIANKFIENVN